MITIAEMDPKQATLHLHGNSGNEIGWMKLQQISGRLIIRIWSNSSCDLLDRNCERTLRKTVKLKDRMAGDLKCTLTLAGTITPADKTALTCNNVEIDLDSKFDGDEVDFLKDGVLSVKVLSAEGIGSYHLTCPGMLS